MSYGYSNLPVAGGHVYPAWRCQRHRLAPSAYPLAHLLPGSPVPHCLARHQSPINAVQECLGSGDCQASCRLNDYIHAAIFCSKQSS